MSQSQPPTPPRLPPSAAEPISSLADQLVEVSAIAGGLAHEIRNPLSTLKVNLQLLDEDWRSIESSDTQPQPDPRDVARRSRRRLETLMSESVRLERILDDFLQYVGKREIDAKPHDLNQVLGELANFYLPQAEAHGVRLRFMPAREPLICMIDPSLIKAAILNLLINAQQAMTDGGEIFIQTRRESDTVARVDVIDTGPGIATEQREDVFRAYFSTKKRGSGLGLAQTRRTIRQHGGRIHLSSDPPHGACFTIFLPTTPQTDDDQPQRDDQSSCEERVPNGEQ